MDSPAPCPCRGFGVHGSRGRCCCHFVYCLSAQSLCCSCPPDRIEVLHSLAMCCTAIPGHDLHLQ